MSKRFGVGIILDIFRAFGGRALVGTPPSMDFVFHLRDPL